MFRIPFIALAIGSLLVAPAFGQLSQEQQKAQQRRESTGEANSQIQLGGQKKDRQISQRIFRNANNRVPHHHYEPR
jgi:hypothetical protein